MKKHQGKFDSFEEQLQKNVLIEKQKKQIMCMC